MDRYKRIYDLGEIKVAIIDDMLNKGASCKKVADKIVHEWGLYDGQHTALTRQLQRYKKDELEPRLAVYSQRPDFQKVEEKHKQYDALDEYLHLIELQKKRISKLMSREEQMPMTFSEVRHEIKCLRELMDSYSKVAIETGAMRRAPTRVHGIIDYESHGQWDQFEADVNEHAEMRQAAQDIIRILQTPDGELSSLVVDGEYDTLPAK